MRPALILALLVACASSQRTSTLDSVYTATLAADSAFEAYSLAHQESILTAGSQKAAVDEQLAAWRDEKIKVLKAFVVVLQAVDAARTANTDASVAAVVSAAALLTAELKKDGVL